MINIIIINWNRIDLLEECLQSLEKQTCKDFDITVVDNGSKDPSVKFLRANYPNVKLIALVENRGFSIANNIAIRQSLSNYIVLLNNDAVADPEWIEKLLMAAERNQDAGFFASSILDYKNRDKIDAAGDIFLTYGIAEKRGNGQKLSKYF